jgi:amino acid adenylation domain-containing protein
VIKEMRDSFPKVPLEQQAIRDKCFHPSGTFVEFPMADIETSIPARFEKIVRMYPDSIAIETDKTSVSYLELNTAANQIARLILTSRSSEPELLGILGGNESNFMAGILGVLKAGKVALLLDSSLPQSRITEVLRVCDAAFVLDCRDHAASNQQIVLENCEVLSCQPLRSIGSSPNPELPLTPDTLAFVFFTSGSTGQPKGVLQNHRNILHNAALRINSYHYSNADRVGLPRSGTSGAVAIFFNAILNGATVIPFDFRREGAVQFANWIVQERISICGMSVPLLRSLGELSSRHQKFPDLRFLQIASQAVYRSDFDLFRRIFSDQCLAVNHLSATETGTICSYFLTAQTILSEDAVPVGYPLHDIEILLMDDQGVPVGDGEVGEIVVGSRYLSPGYWRDPELTAAKFKKDPNGNGKRLYFTGDLGSMRPDGCLIHKGRKDFRLKIRGYGVDIAEVENVLRSHAAVKDAVAMARHDQSGETRLIAYFTVVTQQAPTTSELREYLSKTLSDYMIPSVFVQLDAMPLTPNGKIDRSALPEPGKKRPELRVPYVAPLSDAETRLAEIWAEVLRVNQVGVRDNFFDLGGHSLAASRVISRVIQTFELELPVKALFDAPTIAEMARVIAAHQGSRINNDTLDRMLAEIEAMPDEEAARLLADSGPSDE